MASIHARGNVIWIKVKEAGAWRRRPSPFRVRQEKDARRYADAAQKAIDARAGGADTGPLTVAAYAQKWIEERRERHVRSADDDERRLRLHVLPRVGSIRLDALTDIHVRDLVRSLRKEGELAPRSVRSVFGVGRVALRPR